MALYGPIDPIDPIWLYMALLTPYHHVPLAPSTPLAPLTPYGPIDPIDPIWLYMAPLTPYPHDTIGPIESH